ncbi:MAG: hypothetical protein EBE86_007735 [Hormoscilla sp. GUM202]|nr:hypothetical protein [Hormoscilla sp. GUM202]
MFVEAKSSGQPRLAREAVNKLWRAIAQKGSAYGVFIAPYISPTSAEICAAEGIGCLDLAGNCRLCFGQVYIHKEGKPNPFSQKRYLRSLYAPKSERILRVLLSQSHKAWKVKALASEANVSLGLVSNVKKLLSDREWLSTSADGFCLSHPAALLADWAQNYNYRHNQAFDFYSFKTVGEIEEVLASTCSELGIRYALTGFSGAARYAPVVRYQRVMAYVDADIESLANLLNLKAVNGGANVSLLSPYDEGVFYQARSVDGQAIASGIQLYLDLLGFRGRGEEAATALLEQVIMPQW